MLTESGVPLQDESQLGHGGTDTSDDVNRQGLSRRERNGPEFCIDRMGTKDEKPGRHSEMSEDDLSTCVNRVYEGRRLPAGTERDVVTVEDEKTPGRKQRLHRNGLFKADAYGGKALPVFSLRGFEPGQAAQHG